MLGKNTLYILALSLGLSANLASSAYAQAAPATAGTKIGIVNIQEVILSCNEGQKEFDALQQKFTPKKVELENLKNEVDRLTADYQKTADKLSDEERAARAKAIQSKQTTLQRNSDDAQAEFQQAQQETVNRVGAKVLDTLGKYAEANGYLVVFDVSNPQTPVMFANPGTNITKELIAAYNTQSGVAAPATKTQGAAAAKPATSGTATPKKP